VLVWLIELLGLGERVGPAMKAMTATLTSFLARDQWRGFSSSSLENSMIYLRFRKQNFEWYLRFYLSSILMF